MVSRARPTLEAGERKASSRLTPLLRGGDAAEVLQFGAKPSPDLGDDEGCIEPAEAEQHAVNEVRRARAACSFQCHAKSLASDTCGPRERPRMSAAYALGQGSRRPKCESKIGARRIATPRTF